jgi:TonB family protein
VIKKKTSFPIDYEFGIFFYFWFIINMIVSLFLVFITPALIYAQQTKKTDSLQGYAVLIVCDKMPQFKGGDEARIKYMIENVRYPVLNENEEWQGTVRLSFIIDTIGKIREVGIYGKELPETYSPIEKECVKMVLNMPDWIPGENKGEKVPVRFDMPIRFDPGQ